MKILSETFIVPYGLSADGCSLREFSDTSISKIIQYRSTLIVLVENEVYTAQTVHSVEEVARLVSMGNLHLVRRHHRKLIMARLESALFPDAY